MAEIKFKPCTLYEVDGYTEYQQDGDGAMIEVNPKRGYIRNVVTTPAGGVEDFYDENYGQLPIIPLYANDTHESELVGIRECIDCYDYIKSGLANDIDDTAGFYWVLKNSGGMDDVDLARFVQRMKSVHASLAEGDDVSVEAHTLDIPTEARTAMLELLRRDIYADFQGLDVSEISSAAKTATEIRAAYQNMDNKCADFEYYLISFVDKVLEVAGIDDNPAFRWQKIVNETEQTQMILMAAQYLTDEAVIKHLPFLTPEEADEIIEQREKQEYDQFNQDEATEEENAESMDNEQEPDQDAEDVE